jgi:hypothetical protein
MFNPLIMLAVEANGVIALRMMKLMRGGRKARHEAKVLAPIIHFRNVGSRRSVALSSDYQRIKHWPLTKNPARNGVPNGTAGLGGRDFCREASEYHLTVAEQSRTLTICSVVSGAAAGTSASKAAASV